MRRLPSRLVRVAAIAVLAVVSGCGADSTGSGLTPTIVTPPTKTETFTGVVPVNGADSHPFTTANYGEIAITLTTAGPPDGIVMGVGIGAPASVADSTCQLYQNGYRLTAAGATPQVVGNVPAGAYCVQVFDPGNATGPVSYSVTVVHPR